MICITHPDEDHIRGLKKILKKANPETKILYPNRVIDNMISYGKDAKEVIDEIKKYISMNRNNMNKPKLYSCLGNSIIEEKNIFYNVESGTKYPLEIKTYSPIAEILERHIVKENEICHNEFSIMMSIALGDFKMLFCSDIENDTLSLIDKKYKNEKFFENIINLVKIPHHSSKKSNQIWSLFENIKEFDTAVTTVFRNKNLPNPDELKKYTNKAKDVYSTGNLEAINDNEEYGMIELTVDIQNRTIKEKRFGNAVKV